MSQIPAGRPTTLHASVGAQAARTPERLALITETERLTYAELMARADRLARLLRGRGVDLEQTVGVCLERSADLVVALLAVLRADGTYLPLDPNYPRERVAFMLEDARARWVITRRGLGSLFAEGQGLATEKLYLEELGDELAAQPAGPPGDTALPDSLAYLIYTSGSTGRPKGVSISHRNVVAFFGWAEQLFPLAELRGVFAATSVCFDLSIFELFFPLEVGGTVILGRDALHLSDHPARKEVTLVNTVPSAITELARMGAIPPGVVTVNLAGEPLKRALTDQVYAAGQVRKVYNLYGPSEDTTYSTWVLVPKNSAEEPTIGIPIDGSEGYVVGPRGQLLPEGEVGELYLGGEGVSRGYLGRPAATAEKYLPDPWSGRSGDRLYRTGDRVRRRPDGELEYLGRFDHQVKIRGFRIELGEIEAALARHPGVEMPLALVREDQPGDKRVVAYFQPRGPAPSPGDLRDLLLESLPQHMVPAAFVALDKMPLTPNGKIDRNVLQTLPPQPWHLPAADQAGDEAPRTELERRLATLFAEALGLPEVGIRSSFFELGGHSLLAARIVAGLSRELGIDLGQRQLFETPTVEALAAHLENRRGEAPPIAIPRIERGGDLPISAAQRGLWFLSKLSRSPQYNIVVPVAFEGALDASALLHTLDRLIERHESLRSRIVDSPAGPALRIDPPSAAGLQVEDLAAFADPDAQARQIVESEGGRIFDLEKDRLLRLRLLRLAPQRHWMVLVVSHAVADGISLENFFRELGMLYRETLGFGPAALPALELQAADANAYELERARETEPVSAEFWRQYLKDFDQEGFELPTDRPRAQEAKFLGARLDLAIEPATVDALQAVARQHEATLYMAAAAALYLWLFRLTGHRDLAIGTPFSSRSRPELASFFGYAIHTLPVVFRVSGLPTFAEAVAQTRASVLDVFAHQELPFERLVELLQPPRLASRTAYFDILFQVRDDYFAPDLLPGLETRLLPLHNGTSKVDLEFALVHDRRGGLRAEILYSTEMFEAPTAEALIDSWKCFLEDAAARPSAQVSELEMVPAEQRARMDRWNDTAGLAPLHRHLAELFADVCRRFPQRSALKEGERSLDYRQLEAQSRTLAAKLVAAGVRPGMAVALAFERSIELFVSLMAAIRAGAAYVPLDVSHPADRLSYMLEDCDAKVLVTESRQASRLPLARFEERGGRVLWLDGDAPAHLPDPARPGELPELEEIGAPELPAYILYTSGSTGRPKGVVISQRMIVRLCFDNRFYDFDHNDRIAQVSNASFDVATYEIWGAFLHGGQLVIADRDTLLSAPALRRFLADNRITTLFLTAALFQQHATLEPGMFRGVRKLLVGGDRCDPAAMLAVYRDGPEILANGYGPTEATVFAATWDVEGLTEKSLSVPIGKPLGETELLVIDRWGRRAPIGARGELWIGGEAVAYGYHKRPDLTARSFVPHPESDKPGARVYRSGDLVRLLPSGLVDYIGRIDFQVKVRGFRIELGEIESQLSRHPGITERVVVVQDDGQGGKRLVAYVVARPGFRLEPAQLAEFVGASLPPFMVPSAFVVLERLPLNANGKVDRRALPPVVGIGEAKPTGREPRGLFETRIHAIWCELLQRTSIGVDDENFFEVGGHSVMATRLIARINQAFGVDLPVALIFRAPTIADLTRAVEEAMMADRLQPAAVQERGIAPRKDGGNSPATGAQRALYFLQQLAPSPAYNVPWAIDLHGPLDVPALEAAFHWVWRRHDSLRTRFAVEEGALRQVVAPPSDTPLQVDDFSSLPPSAQQKVVRSLLQREATAIFDLDQGPLWRLRLCRLADHHHLLCLVIHHSVTDGWSEAILVRELGHAYQAFAEGRSPALPAPPLQFGDYAEWREHEPDPAASAAWWKEQLAGLPPLALPTDKPRPEVQTTRGDALTVEWPPEFTQALRRAAAAQRVSLFVLLLAGFYALLHRLGAGDDLAVAVPSSGRGRPELDEVVGYFVSVMVLRARLHAGDDFRALVARTADALRDGQAHQDAGFDRVVQEIKPPRDLSRPPLVQVLFELIEIDLEAAWPGLEAHQRFFHNGTAKFDLSLIAYRTGDELGLSFEFNTDLYERTTIERWLAAYREILAAAVAQPASTLAALGAASLRPAAALPARAPEAAGPLALPFDRDATIDGLFRRQAERTPDATALIWRHERLSYAELARRVDLLAARLRAEGVGVESTVGVYLDRSSDLIVAMIAILSAGGAYLPLDPNYPAERVQFMLDDAGARLVVARPSSAPFLPGRQLVALERGADWQDERPDLPRPSRADALAYLIYTSGSTGKPKGVMVAHRNAVAFFAWADTVFSDIELAGVLAATSVCFDLSIFEIFFTLSRGGAVVLAEHALDLVEMPARDEVTLINTVPSAMNQLVGLGEVPSSVRTVNLAGEPLKRALVDRVYAVPTVEKVYNLYGPSEDTTYSTWYLAAKDSAEEPAIGVPLANSEAHVLDGAGRPVAPGEVGELYLGGEGVARGYWRRPGVTAERFVPDPFGGRPGARLYRTGDRVSRRDDGQLLFLGRVDHQVKLRGFRIELGEIESRLSHHPAIGLALAVVRDFAGESHLLAYAQCRAEGSPPSSAALREWLAETLPTYMVPSFVVLLPALPLTPNGKIDRLALLARPVEVDVARSRANNGDDVPAAPEPALATPAPRAEESIAAVWRDLLKLPEVGWHDNFFDLGGHSLMVVQLLDRLKADFPQVRALDIFRFPTIAKLAEHLRPDAPEPVRAEPSAVALEPFAAPTLPTEPAVLAAAPPSPIPVMPAEPAKRSGEIAIVGMAGRFPGAADLDALWQLVQTGREALRPLSEAEMLADGATPAEIASAEWVRRAGTLDGVELFDAEFFGINAREAQLIDPQHRHFLEVAWLALDHAGHGGGIDAGRVGVYAGTSQSGYLLRHLLAHPEVLAEVGEMLPMIGNDKDFLATRVAYKLDLHGPALTVQTACSTSLVAVHLACRALLDDECDLALAGGATVQLPQASGYAYVSDGINSPDGHCRAFDADARGTVPSSGIGVVALRRLDDALAAGDRVIAVIKGSAINNDGAAKVGYTAPSVEGQRRVIAAALERAALAPADIGYIECHGTGTQLGDPIEVEALKLAYQGAPAGGTALASFKTQVGHMDSAAGIGGLIRAALAVERALLPANLHFRQPNPALGLEGSPFHVATAPRPWRAAVRRAGVSSFGIGGSNAHVVLEEAPAPPPAEPGRDLEVLLLSARTPTALRAMALDLAGALETHGEPLADVAFTLQRGRRSFPHRRAVVAADAHEAATALRAAAEPVQATAAPRVAFLFPGQGAQYAGMGRQLYQREPAYRDEVDAGAAVLRPHLGFDLRELLLGDAPAAHEKLRQTANAQPALFLVEWALAALWRSWGVEPALMLGHSIGELTAAALAGVFTRDAVLRLVAERGRLMQELPAGQMLAIRADEPTVLELLRASGAGESLAIAAINGPSDLVISGPAQAIAALQGPMLAAGLAGRELKTSHAFHSPMMAPILPAFRAAVVEAAPARPTRPFLSNVTGRPITAEQATSPDYWASQLRQPVRFAEGVAGMVAESDLVLLEVGPGRNLTTLARRQAPAGRTLLASLPHATDNKPDLRVLLETYGQLWARGVALDGTAFFAGQRRRRVALPGYPFERRRHWLEAGAPRIEGLPKVDPTLPAADPLPRLEVAQAVAEPAFAEPVATQPPRATTPITALPGGQAKLKRKIAEIWRQLIGVDDLPPGTDFYEAGGDSLGAVQLANRLRQRFGVELRGQEIMAQALTVDAQAELIASRLAAAGSLPDAASPAAAAAIVVEAPPAALAPPAAPPETVPMLKPAARDLPLSDGQERLWVLSQLSPTASASYNIVSLNLLRGPLDTVAFERALRQVVARHEILRTALVAVDGLPWQRVLPHLAFPIERRNLELPPKDRETFLRRHADAVAAQPFDLEQPPLFRAELWRTAKFEHYFLLVIHHSVFDGFSFAVFFRELEACYLGKALPTPPQFGDFAVAQRQRLTDGSLGRELAYWRGQLADAPVLLDLPWDQPRPHVQSFRGDRRSLTLPAERRTALRELGKTAGATLFAPLAAGWALLLARLAGQNDLCLGTPVADRDDLAEESLIGFLVNTVVLRLRFDRDASFFQLIGQVHGLLMDALDHRDLPYERLVEALGVERNAAFNPLFQAMFVLLTGFDENPRFADLQIEGIPSNGLPGAHFDVTLACSELPGGALRLDLDFATDLFAPSTIERWLDTLDHLLRWVVEHPHRPLADLDLITPAAARKLGEWNRTQRLFELGGRRATLGDLFRAQAARTPDGMALVAGGITWSYADLERRALQVVDFLQREGSGVGSMVAIVADRSAWPLAALLGALLAGAAYVPLDPLAPPDRLADLLAQVGARILLGVEADEGRLAATLPAGTRFVALDRLAASPVVPVVLPDLSHDLPAYVFFTSGSTGRPKGVVIQHRQAVNLTRAFIAAHGVRALQRWLVLPPLFFDASVGDVFPALATGGTLYFHPAPEQLHGEALRLYCEEEGITVIDTAAALFKQWVDEWSALGRRRVLPRLEILMVGGESLGLDKLADWRQVHADPARPGQGAWIVNHYGPTETTVCATLQATRDGDDLPRLAVMPIGRPLANVEVHVVDADLRRQPIGVAGELLIGGAGVGLAYLGQAAKTAEAFVPDPFSARPGARLYRTGDLARWLPSGTLEFIGRRDRQIKLRGYRIEPGEIESRLRALPGVGEALATVRDNPRGGQLVAYVTATGEVEPGALRRALQDELPGYMVPSAIVVLSAWPLTANGKIDLRALPSPEEQAEQAFQPPEGPTEANVAAIFAELLKRERVGRFDDFFESGGTSLLAMQLLVRLQQAFGRQAPALAELFEASQVRSLAERIERAAATTLDVSADLRLDPSIRPRREAAPHHPPRHVLVTGATGFLGAFLLDELARNTDGELHVLVRADDTGAALARVRRNLEQYGLWQDAMMSRLRPWLGELGPPRFGLAPADFDALGDRLDAIFHNAATVNFLLPYSRLKAPNVDGTVEALRLAARNGATLHFVSTLGVFLTEPFERGRVDEDSQPLLDGLPHGYEQTKWVAEQLVIEARRRGLRAFVHRPARVTGSSRDGAANTGDLFYSLLKGNLQLGVWPDTELRLDMYPVDVLARAIVRLGELDGPGREYHFYNDRTLWMRDLGLLLQAEGFPIELVTYREWYRRLSEARDDNPLKPFAAVFPDDGFRDDEPLFVANHSRPVLEAAGIEAPAADASLIRRYLDYLLWVGFLKRP